MGPELWIINVKYLGSNFRSNVCERKKMEEVSEFLQEVSLTIYADTFEEQGYDSLHHLLAMGQKELQELQNLIKIRPGHFVRLQLAIEERGAQVSKHSYDSHEFCIRRSQSRIGRIRRYGPDDYGPKHHFGPKR